MKATRQRGRKKNTTCQEKVTDVNRRVSVLPTKWHFWLRQSNPKKNKKWVSSNVRNLVVQAKLRTDMKEQNKKKIVDVIWSLAVIDQAFLLRNLVALIIVTEGSNY